MMSVLCKYGRCDKARFDFRISDGLGDFVEPDWDDPNLKVEFYDSSQTLRFTATASSTPPLAGSEDQSGKFLFVDGIELENFATGVCTAKIYCKVSGAQLIPCPTVMDAFQVVSGTGALPCYTTVSQVRNELPSNTPEQMADMVVEQYIYDASRRIDAFLNGLYSVPFPGMGQAPETPAVIERTARKLAVADCLAFLGMLNQIELKSVIEDQALAELARLRKGELCLDGFNPPVAVYQGGIFQEEAGTGDIVD
jgi:hypothetical protein